MLTRKLGGGTTPTYAVVFDTGDEAVAGLQAFADREGLDAASFTGIGAFASATVAYFDIERKAYVDIPVDEQVEVLVLAGDITRKPGGGRQVHAHVVLGRRDGSTRGGHLTGATVRPTLEVVLTETATHLARAYDDQTGLALIDLDVPG